MNHFHRVAVLMTLLVACTAAWAAPIAKRPPLNKLGQQVADNAGTSLQSIPDASTVPLPAYPGSYFERLVAPGEHPRKGTYVTLVLISNDPPAKVRAWYSKHLKNMKYFSSMKVFAKKDFDGSFRSLFKMPYVMIHPTTTEKLNPNLYELPHVKTEITFGYFAK